MNFGRILDDWESLKSNSKTRSDRDAQNAWLNEHGIMDKDGASGHPREKSGLSKAELERIPVDAVLDLHGKTAAQAESELGVFFDAAETRGFRKLLVIHGKGVHSKGNPVLSDVVRAFLERDPRAGRKGPAPRDKGGSGATWVMLKDFDQRSR